MFTVSLSNPTQICFIAVSSSQRTRLCHCSNLAFKLKLPSSNKRVSALVSVGVYIESTLTLLNKFYRKIIIKTFPYQIILPDIFVLMFGYQLQRK